MFKNTFEGKIVDVIKHTVQNQVVTKLPEDLNTLLSKNDGFVALPVFENWWLDFMSEEGGLQGGHRCWSRQHKRQPNGHGVGLRR